jgi:hypothetical protein
VIRIYGYGTSAFVRTSFVTQVAQDVEKKTKMTAVNAATNFLGMIDPPVILP